MADPRIDRPATQRPAGVTGNVARRRHVAVILLAGLGVALAAPGAAHAACSPNTVVVALESPTNSTMVRLPGPWPKLQGKVVSPVCPPAKDVLYHLNRGRELYGSRALPLTSSQAFSVSFDKPPTSGRYTLDIRARVVINGKLQDGVTTHVSFIAFKPGEAGVIPGPTASHVTVGSAMARGNVSRTVADMLQSDPTGRAAWLALGFLWMGGRG